MSLLGMRVELVPVAAEHVPELRRILATAEVRRRWRQKDASSEWPFDDPSATRFAVLLAGEVRGMVQYREEIVIDPAADNEPAVRCYAAVGFRPVGVMRRYERDADGNDRHDGLLMDLLAEELAQTGQRLRASR